MKDIDTQSAEERLKTLVQLYNSQEFEKITDAQKSKMLAWSKEINYILEENPDLERVTLKLYNLDIPEVYNIDSNNCIQMK